MPSSSRATPSEQPRVGRSLTKLRGPRGTPVGLWPGLAPVRRDTLHALKQRSHILAWSRFWQPQGARIPARGGPGQCRPGLLREQDTCRTPAAARLCLSPARTVHHPQYPVCSHPARCQLPPPHSLVLKLYCQCSPTHTHTLSPVPAGRAHMLLVSPVRCQGTLRSRGLSRRSPQLLCPGVHQHAWPLNRRALPSGAVSHPAGLRNVSAMLWPLCLELSRERALRQPAGTGTVPRGSDGAGCSDAG